MDTVVRHKHVRQDGPEGNQRLTAMAGSLLLVLLAAQGTTLLELHNLIAVHIFIGTLLIGPVLLKISVTLYRFVRYHTGAPAYQRKGKPGLVQRVLGPVVMTTSITQLTTGVILAVGGPGRAGQWIFLHKASFVLWFGAVAIHVLIHAPQLPRLLSARGPVGAPAGRAARWGLVALALGVGVVIAVSMVHFAGPWRTSLRTKG